MKQNKVIAAFTLLVFLASCALIQEQDISNSKVSLLSPADGTETYTQTQTFWWNYVDGAEGYNLQIVSPSFDSIALLVADTNMTVNKFTYTLNPGKYEWAIYAYNYNYASSSPVYSIAITIDSSNNLGNQIMRLQSPIDNFATNNRKVDFKWYALEIANNYLFDIRDSSFADNSSIYTFTTPKDTISYVINEGIYSWGVKASNDQTSTLFSTPRLFIVDTTKPGIPKITNPVANGDSLIDDKVIRWTRTKSSLSAISDTLQLSADSLFINLDEYAPEGIEFDVSDKSDGKYWVRVKSSDAAGNQSNYSNLRLFYIYTQE